MVCAQPRTGRLCSGWLKLAKTSLVPIYQASVISVRWDACRAQRILKDNTHPGNSLFTLLPSWTLEQSICDFRWSLSVSCVKCQTSRRESNIFQCIEKQHTQQIIFIIFSLCIDWFEYTPFNQFSTVNALYTHNLLRVSKENVFGTQF